MKGRGSNLVLFLQAEDGIRDLVRSRGLGDVYKRRAHGATGIVAITDETITVTVTSATSLQLLRLAGAETASFTATSTVNIVKVELP